MIFNLTCKQCLCLFLFAIASANLAVGADNQIDRVLAEQHASVGVQATEVCDDPTFYRRLSLDLIGRVPTTAELEQFLASPDRERAIDHRLQDPEHATFWSQLWTTLLIGRGTQRGVEPEVLRRWIEEQLIANEPIDQMAFRVITAQGVTSLDGPVNYVVAARGDPVMRLSRTFLAVQLDCAECHDHPHDRWTNDDYLAMKRFYQPLRYREVSGGVAVNDVGAGQQRPIFLTGRKPHTDAWRRELGLMVVQSKPFSRAMVNRTWHWLMGRGLIDPVDGLSRDNPAVIPELLESLAGKFRNDFQLQPLIRTICLSEAYQRSPVSNASSDGELQLKFFAARNVRPMLPEQWITSLAVVLNRLVPSPAELATKSQRLLGTVGQAPSTDPFAWKPTSQTLIRQLSGEIPAPLQDLDSLFLGTLARQPTTAERQAAKQHSSQSMLYALVHGNEFITND